MVRWTGLAPCKFEFPFPRSLTSAFLTGGRDVHERDVLALALGLHYQAGAQAHRRERSKQGPLRTQRGVRRSHPTGAFRSQEPPPRTTTGPYA